MSTINVFILASNAFPTGPKRPKTPSPSCRGRDHATDRGHRAQCGAIALGTLGAARASSRRSLSGALPGPQDTPGEIRKCFLGTSRHYDLQILVMFSFEVNMVNVSKVYSFDTFQVYAHELKPCRVVLWSSLGASICSNPQQVGEIKNQVPLIFSLCQIMSNSINVPGVKNC